MTLFLVRHASAGSRSAWTGDDRDRPIDDDGVRTSIELAQQLQNQPITECRSSPYLRCRQTVQPLASALGISIDDDDALAEGAAPKTAAALIQELARHKRSAVLCSHGDIVPATIRALQHDGMRVIGARGSKKGSIWVLETRGRDMVSARYFRRPIDLMTSA